MTVATEAASRRYEPVRDGVSEAVELYIWTHATTMPLLIAFVAAYKC